MAGVTHIRGIDVRCGLTGGDTAIVTGNTATRNFVVIQRRYERQPGCRRHIVAGLTNVRRGRMAGRFTGCQYAIMTTDTGPQHLVVVHWCNKR